MRFAYYVANRIHSFKGENKDFSRPAVRIATCSITIGLVVMLVSISIVLGFKKEIISKVVSFGAHSQIVSLSINEDYEFLPIILNDTIIRTIKNACPESSISYYSSKLGLLKTENEFSGINIKGVGYDYNLDFFKSHIIEGDITVFLNDKSSDKIIISKHTAATLKLLVDDKVYAYFYSKKGMRARKFTVSGIFDTKLTEFDKSVAFTDIYTIRKLNGWDDTMVSGCEISYPSIEYIDRYSENLKDAISKLNNSDGRIYGAFTIKELNPQIFSWLKILDTNIIMIIALMICVSCVTIMSGLLIIILERTNMIGILKSLGASNEDIRSIFIKFTSIVVCKGVVLGNLSAILICCIQKYLKIVTLDSSVYYIDYVPIEFNWLYILLINIFVVSILLASIVFASYFASIKKPIITMNVK